MTYIIVTPDNKIKLLNFPKGIAQPRAIEKAMKHQPDGSRAFDYDKPFPAAPAETWVWNDETQTIVIDESLAHINWAGLMADIIGLDVELKLKLGSSYVSIIQALLEADETYLLRTYVSRETSLSDKNRSTLLSIFLLHNVNMDQWIDKIPF